MRLFPQTDPSSSTDIASPFRGRVVGALRLAWLAFLVLPAGLSITAAEPWELDSRLLFALSCWLVVAARLLMPARWFFPLTLPVAVASMLCTGAEMLRHVDLLDLGLQWRTFTAEEVRVSLRPYAAIAVLGTLVLAAWCWACARGPDARRFVRALPIGVALVTLLLVPLVPPAAWLRAWPSNAVLVAARAASGWQPLAKRHYVPESNPRDPQATWHGRATSTARRQTLVFIVGESVRADSLRECHGPDRVRAVSDGALVACDVTAGADATHTSVPLLISREMPGGPERISRDATFERAFQEAGFETSWIGDQPSALAWPDAQFQAYPNYETSDEAALDAPFAAILARAARRKVIVLHAYNAHDPYCARYVAASAPYAANCENLKSTRVAYPADLRLAYANAVDISVRYIDGVIDTLRHQPGEVFLLFTPDHGENLYDDPRQLHGHALRSPTRWDIRVPAIFWANDAWRSAHPRQWANLQAQATAPLMHADMVPTFLAAAGVTYDEPRKGAIDLLDATVPARQRTVQRAQGVTTDWDTLVREAR